MVSSPLATQPDIQNPEIVYPSSDGEPVAESFVHLYALLATLEVLRQYLDEQQAVVLANQFLYYSQGFPKLRVAPDVMVIFGVEPGDRDNYKIWQEGEVPSVVFEMTSKGTRANDETFKKTLYAQLGVQEYWLFDPRGEWLEPALQGYRLHRDEYEPITDGHSEVLKLRLEAEGQLISFYRDGTGEKLLIPGELATALKQKSTALEMEQQKTEKLKAKLQELGVDPDEVLG